MPAAVPLYQVTRSTCTRISGIAPILNVEDNGWIVNPDLGPTGLANLGLD